MKTFYVYFMANQSNTTLYTGMTNNIERRVNEHKGKINSGFTAKYNCTKLVYFEIHSSAREAINREKQIKAGSRKKKEALVNSINDKWEDLAVNWK